MFFRACSCLIEQLCVRNRLQRLGRRLDEKANLGRDMRFPRSESPSRHLISLLKVFRVDYRQMVEPKRNRRGRQKERTINRRTHPNPIMGFRNKLGKRRHGVLGSIPSLHNEDDPSARLEGLFIKHGAISFAPSIRTEVSSATREMI